MHIKPYPKSYLPLLLCFILTNEILDNYILNIYSVIGTGSETKEYFFYLLFLFIQIFASPIQAGYSDFYCRKKSLVVSLLFSAIALVPVFFYFNKISSPILMLVLMTLLKGIFGNVLPLSWAGIADTQTKNIRLSFGLSTSAIAFGYLALIVLNKFLNFKDISIILFPAFVLLTFLCLKKFFDIRADKKDPSEEAGKPSIKKDVKELIDEFLKHYKFRKGLYAFLLWEISFYSVHMLDVDLRILEFKGLTLSMIFGYILGVSFLKFSKKEDNELITIGYTISVISIIPIFIVFPFISNVKLILVPCYFIYAIGVAFLVPNLFAIMAKERKPHEQGKIYGLFDSTDTVAFLVSSIIAMIYNYLELNQLFIVGFSFFIFIISWLPYAKFRKAPSSGRKHQIK